MNHGGQAAIVRAEAVDGADRGCFAAQYFPVNEYYYYVCDVSKNFCQGVAEEDILLSGISCSEKLRELCWREPRPLHYLSLPWASALESIPVLVSPSHAY